MAKRKQRVDLSLVERGLAESRTRAQALIMAGLVYHKEQRIDKPGQELPLDASLSVRGLDHPWVSRGGMKLAHALRYFEVDPDRMTAIDVGASTGGFTDVLLSHGASKVYAVDVGQGQLAWKLRNDPRVVVMEKINARYLDRTLISEPIDLIVCDASFIGLETVLPAPMALVVSPATLIALIKPQFEVGRERVGKGGVVRDPVLHREVCDRIHLWLDSRKGWRFEKMTESPILGPEGNREFLICGKYEL